MTPMRAHASAHTCAALLAAMTVVAAFATAAAIWLTRRPNASEADLTVVAALAPMALAAFVGLAVRYPLGELTVTAARPCLRWVLLVVAGLALIGAALAALPLGVGGVSSSYGPLTGLRNFAGFLGLALVGAVTVGAPRSWSVPMSYGLFAFFVAHTHGGEPPLWAWLSRPIPDPAAALVALGLLTLGMLAVLAFGLRLDTGAEAET